MSTDFLTRDEIADANITATCKGCGRTISDCAADGFCEARRAANSRMNDILRKAQATARDRR